MTPEERAVIQAAISMHRIGRVPTRQEENVLRTAVHRLIFACPECNAGGHTCPGDGNSIGHGDSSCGEHGENPNVVTPARRLADYLSEYAHSVVEEWMRIVEVDESTIEPGSAEFQARATWMGDGTFALGEHPHAEEFGHFRLTVRVDPIEVPPIGPECDPALQVEMEAEEPPRWVPTEWQYVTSGDRVRLGTSEAEVTQATRFDGHTKVDSWRDRNTGKMRDNVTGRWDHTEIRIRLAHLPNVLEFPPAGPVEVLMDASRRAEHIVRVNLGWETIDRE